MIENYILKLTDVSVGEEGWANDDYHVKPQIQTEADVTAIIEIVLY